MHLAVSTRGPGGKETPPCLFEEVHFSANKFTSAREDKRDGWGGGGSGAVEDVAVFTLAFCKFCQHAANRLLRITWEETNERIDAIT